MAFKPYAMRSQSALFVPFLLFVGALALVACAKPEPRVEVVDETDGEERFEQQEYALAIHGGAGVIRREDLDSLTEKSIRAALDSALQLGESLLRNGSSAADAVVATVSFMEDSPYFNAGKGAVFNYEGTNELDASLMSGRDLEAGAVAGVVGVKHPIQLARAVMDSSVHVLLSGAGAVEFARQQGLEEAPPAWFRTERRYESWQRARAQSDAKPRLSEDGKFGTVGCVALDKDGHLAAGTSTGGMTLKRFGRIGDSPLIGAGTYADDRSCAVSATGHGEYFIRYAVAHDVAARMAYGREPLETAADKVIQQELKAVGGEGGIIAVDHFGNVAMPFNSEGMYRGYATPNGRAVMIFGDEVDEIR